MSEEKLNEAFEKSKALKEKAEEIGQSGDDRFTWKNGDLELLNEDDRPKPDDRDGVRSDVGGLRQARG